VAFVVYRSSGDHCVFELAGERREVREDLEDALRQNPKMPIVARSEPDDEVANLIRPALNPTTTQP
jgi:hypothetical protein